jgi:hypothetical protein
LLYYLATRYLLRALLLSLALLLTPARRRPPRSSLRLLCTAIGYALQRVQLFCACLTLGLTNARKLLHGRSTDYAAAEGPARLLPEHRLELQGGGQEFELVLVGVSRFNFGFLLEDIPLLELGLGVGPIRLLLLGRPEKGLPFQLEQFEVNLARKFENCLREVHEEATERDVEEVQGRRVELQVGSDAANRVQEGDADICHLVCGKREVEVEKVLLKGLIAKHFNC